MTGHMKAPLARGKPAINPLNRVSRARVPPTAASLTALAFLLGTITTARAETECTGKVTRIWTGNAGALWVIMDTGLVWFTSQSDLDRESILASATTAMEYDRSITVRFIATSVPCTGTRGE